MAPEFAMCLLLTMQLYSVSKSNRAASSAEIWWNTSAGSTPMLSVAMLNYRITMETKDISVSRDTSAVK
jgi:hypothetical protein